MLGARSDLPLEQDESSRFIPYIIALMVYLATLALAGALVADSAVERWSRGLSGSLTVQITPGRDADPAERKSRIENAIALLDQTPGVTHAEALSDERIAALLEPWLGEAATSDLPLPAIIDVHVDPAAPLHIQELSHRLADAVPGATVDDHQRWLRQLIGYGHSVEFIAALILAFIALAAAIATVFGTRTALAIHRNVIEVMHLIGATDTYVARQFQAHALGIALRGGTVGFLVAVLTLIIVEYLTEAAGGGLLPSLALAPWQWAVLPILPVATAAIAMMTARTTVVRTLARMV
jgi:cell division transport system permease protein